MTQHPAELAHPVVDFAKLAPQPCPCGATRRAFLDVPDYPLSVHRVEIAEDAQVHYHRELIETYYVLECRGDAAIQLDGELLPVHPGMCVVIRPGVRHRAVGKMTVLVIVTPKFREDDEWFD